MSSGEGRNAAAASDGLSFGFVTMPGRAEIEALEALPIDSLWVGGHVASRNPSPEAMVQLARLAGLAQRVRIGTSILLLPLYPPAIIAKQIADLDQHTGGRVSLGIGVGGEYPQEFRACGVPLTERGARTDEAIELIRKLWTGEEITHRGRFFPIEQVRILPASRRVGGPPILVAGRQEVAMRRAARLGDGWMPYMYSPRRYAESVARIREFAKQAGRSLDRFEWLHFLFANVQEDTNRARAETAAFLAGTYQQDLKAMVDRVAAAGNPEQVASRVREFVDAGARHVLFALATKRDRLAMAKSIANEVIPRVVQSRKA
jgi:probable F420-dependent oxidoreductase